MLLDRNLILRTLSAACLIPLVGWLLFFAPHKVGVAFLALIYTGMVWEWHRMNKNRPHTALYLLGHLYIASSISVIYALIPLKFVLFLLLILVWSNDIFAYLVGRTLGGPKLWPSASPSKTWSGFIGGVALGTACTAWISSYFELSIGLSTLLLLSLASHGGDLLESVCKRYYGVKDSSQIIPGHGGLLDRLDSLMAVAIIYWILQKISF